MEILGCAGAVADLHVVFRAQLKESFNACAGVLRTLPLITMWQKQNQADGLLPLGLGASNELVNDDLSSIGEVSKLRLPEYQRQRVGHTVAKFKAKHDRFRKQAIEDLEFCLSWREVLQRQIFLAIDFVEQHAMALAEGSATTVLPAEPYWRSFDHQCPKRERFCESPVDFAIFVDGLPPPL